MKLIEEEDPMFDLLVPVKHPFHENVIFGFVRTLSNFLIGGLFICLGSYLLILPIIFFFSTGDTYGVST